MSKGTTPRQVVDRGAEKIGITFTEPQADIMSCLLAGLIAGLPCFLEAFMKCMAGGTTAGDYKPGDRNRCN